MQITTGCSRIRSWATLLLVLFVAGHASAGSIGNVSEHSQASLAFARYIAVVQGRDPFTESGPVAVFIEASLPQLYKTAELLAIRQIDETERNQYRVISFQGDGTVAEEVIDRYVGLNQVLQQLPLSSIAIVPGNYKFRFRGEVKTGGRTAYMYDISPRKNRVGLIKGQIWIDARTGAEIFLSGRLTFPKSIRGGVSVVRETTPPNDSGVARTTHLVFSVPQLGRSEVAVVELPLPSGQAPEELASRSRL